MSSQPNGHGPGINGRQNGELNGHHGSPSAATEKVAPATPSSLESPHIVSQRTMPVRPGDKRAVDLDNYFSGPLDPTKHSKLPYFMRLHGSILPSLVMPILFVAAWATTITVISERVHSLAVDSLLLTVLGFVVGLSLSFRSSTAYERYAEGRKFWAQMTLHSRNLARIIWIHTSEREGEEGKDDVLGKVSAINLILGFCQAVKHKLRHEIEADYADLEPLIDHLNTFAKRARSSDRSATAHNLGLSNRSKFQTWGENLGLPFCESNPQKSIKVARKQGKHHGNLPLEIMNYLSSYYEHCIKSGTLTGPCWQSQVSTSLMLMMDAYGGCERVLSTPLPLAYNIAISQITWLYVLVLPFQLCAKLRWAAIPGTIVAAYIILGIAAIGREIEDPFGRDVNDLDLDRYCTSLQLDLNVLTSSPPPKAQEWLKAPANTPLWPYSLSSYDSWRARQQGEIRRALVHRVDHQSVELADHEDSAKRVEGRHGDV
ncbi:Bestrophin, RFP-TM, chloride channel-domain-containing protein [Tuber indicum]|nr:Bestrophin, RFP-TM, chloride channel-domain-containing protein [Tuber indicum]